MNTRIMFFLLLFIAAHATTKAQMTVGGSYKPSHTLVVKGQVKIDTVKSGSIVDSLLTIGADSVLHRLPISSIADGSQTRVTAGTNTTVTGTGTTTTPYVINSVIPATSHTVGVSGNTLTSTVNGVSATTPVIGSVSSTSTGNSFSTTVNGQTSSSVSIINSNTNALTQAGGLVTNVNGISATTTIAAGTPTNILGFDASGAPVYQTPSTILGSATTHTLGVSGNTLTSTVNGKAATASIIGTLSNSSSANSLTTTINGQASTPVNIINTNTLTNTNGSLVSTVNGVASTPGVSILGSASNGLTATSGNVVLGGTLSAATSIAGGANTLGITSSVANGFNVNSTTFSVDGANNRVGIGTSAPSVKLHVTGTTAGGSFRMVDGTQATDKVLTSDANGNSTWTTIPGNTSAVLGTLSTATNNLSVTSDTYTGSTITLPAGKWAVNMIFLIKLSTDVITGYGKWVRTTLTDGSGNSASSSDIQGNTKLCSGGILGPSSYGLVNGVIIVNNTSGASKTYYVWVKAGEKFGGIGAGNETLSNFATTAWSENQIIASPIK